MHDPALELHKPKGIKVRDICTAMLTTALLVTDKLQIILVVLQQRINMLYGHHRLLFSYKEK